jgi:hypothetical protein
VAEKTSGRLTQAYHTVTAVTPRINRDAIATVMSRKDIAEMPPQKTRSANGAKTGRGMG